MRSPVNENTKFEVAWNDETSEWWTDLTYRITTLQTAKEKALATLKRAPIKKVVSPSEMSPIDKDCLEYDEITMISITPPKETIMLETSRHGSFSFKNE